MDKKHALILDQLDPGNQDWYNLYNESNDLYGRFEQIYKNFSKIKVPKLFPWKLKKEFKILQLEFVEIMPDFNNWWRKARTFIEKPSMHIASKDEYPEDRTIGFIHYLLIISNRITILETRVNNLARDFQFYVIMLKNLESHFWALTYFSAGILISITLAIMSIW